MALRGGLEETASRWATYPVDSNVPTAESVRTGRPVLVRRDEVDERYPDLGGFADGTGSILCLPLAVAGGRVLGAVSLSFPGRRALSEAENLFLQLLADTCAMTLDRVEAQRAAARPGGQAGVPGRGERQAVERPGLRGDADGGRGGRGPVVRGLVRDLPGGGRPAADDRGGAHPPRADRAGARAAGALPRRPQRPTRAATGCCAPVTSQLVPEVTRRAAGRSRRRTRSTCELMRALNLRSGMSCALKVGDRIFGVITLGRGRGRAALLRGRPGLRRGPGPAGRDRHRQRPAAQPGAHRRARAAARGAAGGAAATSRAGRPASSTSRPVAPTPAATSTTSYRSRTAGSPCSSAT